MLRERTPRICRGKIVAPLSRRRHERLTGARLMTCAILSLTVKAPLPKRHSDLARERHEELAHPQVVAVAVSGVAAGFCKSPLRRFSLRPSTGKV